MTTRIYLAGPMTGIAILTLALALAACNSDSWMDAASQYQCTETQMQKVQNETLFCKKEADYGAAYCYSSAIQRNCEPKRSDIPTGIAKSAVAA